MFRNFGPWPLAQGIYGPKILGQSSKYFYNNLILLLGLSTSAFVAYCKAIKAIWGLWMNLKPPPNKNLTKYLVYCWIPDLDNQEL